MFELLQELHREVADQLIKAARVTRPSYRGLDGVDF